MAIHFLRVNSMVRQSISLARYIYYLGRKIMAQKSKEKNELYNASNILVFIAIV